MHSTDEANRHDRKATHEHDKQTKTSNRKEGPTEDFFMDKVVDHWINRSRMALAKHSTAYDGMASKPVMTLVNR